jgi:A/G-specific adenine glycosylase
VVERADGFVLIRRRADKGLLGGMIEVPTSPWTRDFEEAEALAGAPVFSGRGHRCGWRRVPGVVSHTFTHFPLELVVYTINVPKNAAAPAGTRWTAISDLAGEALPNVMRKVLAHALGRDRCAARPTARGKDLK